MRGYTQLTRDERYQIYALRKAGHSQKEIAEVLKGAFPGLPPAHRSGCRLGRAQRPDALLGDEHLDESAFAKKGTASAGVARMWNGRLGKVDNSQVGVFSALCGPTRD